MRVQNVGETTKLCIGGIIAIMDAGGYRMAILMMLTTNYIKFKIHEDKLENSL